MLSVRGRLCQPSTHGSRPLTPNGAGSKGFVLFLESFAPLVNSLNLGIASPLVLGPPPFQLAHIKTQLALQQLTSVAASSSALPHARFGRAFLKSTMFSPRGALPQRPRGPNPSGAKPPGSFQGGGGPGPQRQPAPGAPQGAAPRASGQDSVPWTGSQRINVRVTLHRADPRQAKAKSNLHQEQKGDVRAGRWDGSPCPPPPVSQKPPAPARLPEQNAGAQNRYTPESASSILASFGLSNEDLEELSRYPDDQLTPENMPLILREIRMRKMGHPLPGLHSQSRGEAMGGTSGAAVKGKVIDYGHASRYGYTEDPLEVRGYNVEALREEPLEARAYNPEASSREKREEFQREPSVPMGVPPAGVACGPAFPPQDVMKPPPPPPAFQSDPANPHPFFPAEPAGKAGGLCAAPVGKAGPPPAVLPVMPPILPLAVPPLAQPVMPPLISQPVVPLLPQPPFSAELLAILEQRDRIQQDSGSGQPSAPSPGVGQKPFQPQPEGPIKSPFGVVKASWLPAFLQSDAQKIKRLPTPSMMNDYYATSPRIFPHMCSLCNVECARMKDWILHQNTPSHIESCRHLRQQYPEWNPEARSSKRNAADRKENQTPKHRSNSASPSPRRPRPAGSSYVPRHSRSRSRSPGRYRPTRPRSRSPRQVRRLSPRHWSRSPQRSRNPLRGSPRPQRSSSHDWSSRRATRSQDRKAALEAVMKTLGPGFVAEFNKHKSSQAGTPGSGKSAPSHGAGGKVPGNGKKTPKTGIAAKAAKKDALPPPAPGSCSPQGDEVPQEKEMEEEEEEEEEGSPAGPSRPRAAPYNRLLREELLNCGTVLQISNLPDDGFSDQDIKKIVQPFGKVSDLIVLRSRNKAYLEMNYKEAVIAAVKYGETVPVLVNGRQVKISVAEKPKASPSQAKTSVKKKTQTVKKAAPSTKKHPTTTTATTKTKKTIAGKKEKTKKSVGTKESKTKRTSGTAAQSDENESKELQSSPGSGVEAGDAGLPEPTGAAGGDEGGTEPAKAGDAPSKGASNPAPLPEKPAQVLQAVPAGSDGQNEALIDPEASAETVKSEEAAEPGGKEAEDACVVLVSNLPEKGYSVEEVSNLAKPFGGLRDVLIVSSHKKAYLEINRKSAESMVKFYTCFPMTLDGNQLCIDVAPQHKTVRDEEAIFTAIIKDSDPKVNAEALHHQFVHLGNLPDEGYREFEVVCVGLRFGKVDHYVVLKNKNKAILQLESPKAARSMYCFLNQYSYTMGGHTLTCTLSPSRQHADTEAVKKEAKKEEPSRGSSSLKKHPEGSGAVQTAAAHPPVEPSVVKKEPVSTPPAKDELSAVKAEPSESRLEGARRGSAAGSGDPAAGKAGAGAELPGAPLAAAGADLTTAEPEEKLPPAPSVGKEEEVTGGAASELPVPAAGSAPQKGRALGAEGLGATAGERPGGAPGRGDHVPFHHVPSSHVPSGTAAPLGAEPRAVPPAHGAAETGSCVVPHGNPKASVPKKTRVSDPGKMEHEKPRAPTAEVRPVLEAGAALGRTRGGAGDRAEGAVLCGGSAWEESSQQLLAKAGAAVENADKNAKEKEGSSIRAPQSKETGPGKVKEAGKAAASNSSLSAQEPSSVSKITLKAVVPVPDILKPRVAAQRSKPAPCKGGKQAASSKARAQGAAAGQKKAAWKDGGHPRAGGSQNPAGSTSQQSGAAGTGKAGSGRNASQQEKDSQVEPRAGSKQEGESRWASTKRDAGSTAGFRWGQCSNVQKQQQQQQQQAEGGRRAVPVQPGRVCHCGRGDRGERASRSKPAQSAQGEEEGGCQELLGARLQEEEGEELPAAPGGERAVLRHAG
ncbi:zinc finger protein 638 isoform X2 [Numida meleagris]|uniref:zinc finger protein 638 isoform X2 n=1 Tax=Numida meleagris TaxID=8996 RepID=UPI000B3DC10B|nr:zinc finger protein 638 isoform X2 [Numida meleagris]